jgi:hypothetical protein
MRDYGKIYTAIWRSRKFRGLPSDDCRLLYLYLHTSPHTNMIGCFVLDEGYAMADLGWASKRYRDCIDTLSKAYLIGFDRDESVVRIVDFIKHDPFSNPKHAVAAVRMAEKLPDCQEKQRLIEDLARAKHVNPATLPDTLSIPYRYQEPEPEQEPEQEQELRGTNVPRSSVDHEACIAHFNAVAERVGWAQVQKISATRKAALSQRISDCGGADAWCEAMERAGRSPLLTGQTGRGWRADFDWLCKAANFTKLMEGNYDPRHNGADQPTHQRGSGGAHDSMVAAFAFVANRESH